MQNYTDNANEDVPLAVQNVIFLISFEINVCTCSFGKKNKADQSFSLKKLFLLSFLS